MSNSSSDEMNKEKDSMDDASRVDPQIAELNEQLKKAEELLEAEKNSKLQVMADFQNYRRHMEQERSTFGAMANMAIIQEFLEVYDDMQMALNDESLSLEDAKKAIANAQGKLVSTAKNAGVEPLEVAAGDDFNSATMEAISTIPNPKLKGKIVAVISTGFKYKNKDGIIKSSKVIVGK